MGLVRLEIPFVANAAGAFTANARREGDGGALFSEITSTITDVTGEADDNSLVLPAGHGVSVGDTVTFVSKTGGTGASLNTAYDVLSVTATGCVIDVNFTTDISAATLNVCREAVVRKAWLALKDHLYGDLTQGPVVIINPSTLATERPI